MRVLTFNSHEAYLHLLAGLLPWSVGIVAPRLGSGRVKHWDDSIRPLPPNATLYGSVEEARDAGDWDWVLAHNVHDLLDARPLGTPKVFLVHGTLSGRILQDGSAVDPGRYRRDLRTLLARERCVVAYVSELKRDDLGIPGCVIRPAVEPAWYGGYRGDICGVLRVCNYLKERGAMLGYAAHEEVCRGLPSLVLGENGPLPNSRLPGSWDDLREAYRGFRVYLHTAVHPYEDGWNLAVLEAMATGMPIAVLRHPTAPVRDGVEGVVGDDAADLHRRVGRLLEDPERARELGEGARRRVSENFAPGRFRSAWQALARRL